MYWVPGCWLADVDRFDNYSILLYNVFTPKRNTFPFEYAWQKQETQIYMKADVMLLSQLLWWNETNINGAIKVFF